MAEEIKMAVEVAGKKSKHRSPNYPVIGLRKGIERAESLYKEYKRHWVPVGVAQEKWSYKKFSGVGEQIIAAMRAFGLIDVQGIGQQRQIRLSDVAYKIVENHEDKASLMKHSALGPPLHAELWKKYSSEGLPPDEVIRHYLKFERNFNPESVDSFIAQFKDTVAFAKLYSSVKMTDGETKDEDAADSESICLGDSVQWEPKGIAQFSEPRRVTGKSPDDAWLFVEGSETGLPVKELRRVKPPEVEILSHTNTSSPPPNPNYTPPPSAAKQFNLTTDTGDVIVRWPSVLSEEDYETVESWLDGLKKKIKRSVQTKEPSKAN
jgi:hypothetical protein